MGPAEGSVADVHHMFNLISASGGAIPLSRYLELDVKFLELQVLRVGFLITQKPNKVLDPDHETILPRIVGWNLVKLAPRNFSKSITSMYLRILNPQMDSILCYFLSCAFTTMLM